MQSVLLGVRAKVMEGHTLADALGEFPRVFPEIYRATVAAGEQAGHLDEILERLADYTENREVIRQKVLGAMLYPIALTVMCFGIVSLLLVYVVPKVVDVFESYRAQLPIATRVLIWSSEFARHYGLWVFIGLVALGFFVARQLRQPAVRMRFDRLQFAHSNRWPGRTRLQHRALHAHAVHPRRQLGAGAGGPAHRRRGGHQPADARGGCHGNGPRARGARRSGARWRRAGYSRQ